MEKDKEVTATAVKHVIGSALAFIGECVESIVRLPQNIAEEIRYQKDKKKT